MIKATILSAIILFLLCFIVIFCIAFSRDETSEIQENGERYGASDFYKHKDKIYALVIGNGMLEVEGVDIPTFKVFDTEYNNRNVAYDKNKIYFGNIAVSDLDTDKLYYVGNNYYSDGTNSYFCSTSVETYEELSALSINIKNISHFLFKTKRPQYYFYPYKKLETNKRLEKVEELRNFATDGEKVYYKGEVLENADLNTLKSVNDYNEYFADKENVYYKSKLLPIKNSGKLKIVSTEQGNEFLYDEVNGYVFMGTYSFDRGKAPYKVLGNEGNHLNSLVFINNEGVYYYDTKLKKQKRAGDNIFIGNIEEISPNVFTDDENIYYFHAYSIWSKRKGGGGGLASRNTEIYYLDKKEGWKKIADIGSGVYGSVWQKGDKYYYFDNLGISQLIDNAIYEITDMKTLEELRSSQNDGVIKELIEDEKLIKVEGEKKIKIVEKYKGNWDYFMIFFILCIFIVPTIFNACKKIISRRIDNEAGRF